MTDRRWQLGLVFALGVICCADAARAQLPDVAVTARKAKPPAAAEITRIKTQWRESNSRLFTQARTAREKAALVTTVLASARQADKEPAEKFALQDLARDVAISAGDWEGGLMAITEGLKDFDVDPFDLADEMRAKMDGSNNPPLDSKKAFLLTVQLVDKACGKDRYDVAERFAESAQKIARKAGETTLANQIGSRLPDLQSLSRQWGALQPSLATLDKSPLDPAANLAVGKFRCYEQGRWDEGLLMLALGSDVELARIAEAELRAAGSAEELVKLADQWRDVAAIAKDDARALRRHAVDCYLQARVRLPAAEQQRIDAILAEAEKWHSKDATYIISPTITPASPPFDKAHSPMPTLLNAVDRFYKEKNGAEFAFHITNPNAYIVVDLKRETAISRMQILNSVGGDTSPRTRGMQVFLSNAPDSRGVEVWSAPDGADEWNVILPKLHTARFVILALKPGQSGTVFHLRKVKIFGPE